MSYNVHSFVGTDGVYDPDRIARVIDESGAAVVALQEVDFGRGPRNDRSAIEVLAERIGMSCHFTLTREGRNGRFGNAVLTPHTCQLVAEGMLPRRRGEARAVQWVKIVSPTWQMQLMNTHLSINFGERRVQAQALLGAEWLLQARTELPIVVCGDFNSSPLSGVYRRLSRDLRDVQARRWRGRPTWPAQLPFWRIDHMFVSKDVVVHGVEVLRDGWARVASDHLPLVAELSLGVPACERS
jgi:endonuclease/exonuclease/phosphatase family metal-dependent hydrolase